MVTTIAVGMVALVIGGYLGVLFSPFRTSKPKVEERVVFGGTTKATLYSVWVPDKDGTTSYGLSGKPIYHDGETLYYLTCEQAHAEHPGVNVSAEQALIVGGDYIVGKFKAAKVQPKPKVAKGRK